MGFISLLCTSPSRGTSILNLFLKNHPSTVINTKVLLGISGHDIVLVVTSLFPNNLDGRYTCIIRPNGQQ